MSTTEIQLTRPQMDYPISKSSRLQKILFLLKMPQNTGFPYYIYTKLGKNSLNYQLYIKFNSMDKNVKHTYEGSS